MPTETQLPSAFTSLYRLFLRSVSASVLHHSRANNLKRLWRPVFQEAAGVIRRLEDKTSAREQEELRRWLNLWQKRVDNTLSVLSNSAISRGLPHRLSMNLALLERYHTFSTSYDALRARTHWNPQLPLSSPDYQPKTAALGSRADKKSKVKQERDDFNSVAWEALGEVIRMAEGRHAILLGRIMKR